MDRQRLEASLEGIRHLLSHLHGEVTALESSYEQVLGVLRKLETAVELDDLTQLLRRKAFFAKWQGILEACRQVNEGYGVILIDIDHFKKINDTHGHQTGDEVIKRVAGLLKEFESADCAVGRYGGEEFALATKGSEAEILGLAELIRQRAERLGGEAPGGSAWKCTISLGVAAAGSAGADPHQLIHSADEALYEAKNSGRNRVKAA